MTDLTLAELETLHWLVERERYADNSPPMAQILTAIVVKLGRAITNAGGTIPRSRR